MAVTFDTLQYSEELKLSGVPEEQAKAQAKALANALKDSAGQLATKENLLEVKQELKADIAEVKGDVKLLRWMLGFNLALSVALLWLPIRSGMSST